MSISEVSRLGNWSELLNDIGGTKMTTLLCKFLSVFIMFTMLLTPFATVVNAASDSPLPESSIQASIPA